MMKMLSKSCFKNFARSMESLATFTRSEIYAEPLNKRGLIRVHGPNAFQFLQGLITNDMTKINVTNSIYTMFLNGSGRLLYDSIIYACPEKDTFYIECDKAISPELRRHLRLYRVRQKIEIDSIEGELTPWAIFNKSNTPFFGDITKNDTIEGTSILVSEDPRLPSLGLRIIVPQSYDLANVQTILQPKSISSPVGDDNYQNHRYNLGVGEGIIDHPPGKSFPLEANGDFLNGVSFRKGCYLGQELTARVHHTGVIRKRLMPIALSKPIDVSVKNVQSESGSIIGQIRGCTNKRALGLIRVEHVVKVPNLKIDGESCKAYFPDWWNKDYLNIKI